MLYSISNDKVKYLNGSFWRNFIISGSIRDEERFIGMWKRAYEIQKSKNKYFIKKLLVPVLLHSISHLSCIFIFIFKQIIVHCYVKISWVGFGRHLLCTWNFCLIQSSVRHNCNEQRSHFNTWLNLKGHFHNLLLYPRLPWCKWLFLSSKTADRAYW